MKLFFLGTNGWHDSETGETPCVLIDSEEAYVVLDAGNALRKLDRHIRADKPIYLFLSHFHLDHVSGLHTLMKFSFAQGMTIAGQPGTKEILGRLVASPFTAPLEKVRQKYPVDVVEIREGGNRVGPLEVHALPLVHADPCFGYSLHLEGRKIAYCTDTGACPNLVRLAEGADLLITECAWRKRHESAWPHLAPEDAAEAARDAGARRLALMHFDAVNYPTMAARREAESAARRIFPGAFAAEDDMEIRL
jgi:ribonuclease BN (tRNA processing enzyme)